MGAAQGEESACDYRRLAAQVHRLSNVVQIVAALLADRRRRLTNPVAREQIEWAEQLVRSLMLVVGQGERSSDGDFHELFVCHLASWRDVLAGRSIDLDTETDKFPILSSIQITVLLIADELLTNAMKHAFRDREDGHIRLSLKQIDERWAELLVADNGNGSPAGTPVPGLGLELLERLVQGMGGSLSVENDGGVTARVGFPIA